MAAKPTPTSRLFSRRDLEALGLFAVGAAMLPVATYAQHLLPLDWLLRSDLITNVALAGVTLSVYGIGFIVVAWLLLRRRPASHWLVVKGALMAVLSLCLAIVVLNCVDFSHVSLEGQLWLDVLGYVLFGAFYVMSWLLMKNPSAAR